MTARSHSRNRKRRKRSLAALKRREVLRAAARERPRLPSSAHARRMLNVPSVLGEDYAPEGAPRGQ